MILLLYTNNKNNINLRDYLNISDFYSLMLRISFTIDLYIYKKFCNYLNFLKQDVINK